LIFDQTRPASSGTSPVLSGENRKMPISPRDRPWVSDLTDNTEVFYQMSQPYRPIARQAFAGTTLPSIEWFLDERIINERDQTYRTSAADGRHTDSAIEELAV
jgi:dTDP-4-dehydrorhamnose 3,5-epimerase-like enzyme